jgi:hypothetical protein
LIARLPPKFIVPLLDTFPLMVCVPFRVRVPPLFTVIGPEVMLPLLVIVKPLWSVLVPTLGKVSVPPELLVIEPLEKVGFRGARVPPLAFVTAPPV